MGQYKQDEPNKPQDPQRQQNPQPQRTSDPQRQQQPGQPGQQPGQEGGRPANPRPAGREGDASCSSEVCQQPAGEGGELVPAQKESKEENVDA